MKYYYYPILPNGKLIEYNDKIYYVNSPIALQQQIGDNYSTTQFKKTVSINITSHRKNEAVSQKLFDIPYNLNEYIYWSFYAEANTTVTVESYYGSDPTYTSYYVYLYDNDNAERVCDIMAYGIIIPSHEYTASNISDDDSIKPNIALCTTNGLTIIRHNQSDARYIPYHKTLSTNTSIYIECYNSTRTTPTQFTGNLLITMYAFKMIA